MSRGPHECESLEDGWWDLFEALLSTEGYTLERFCSEEPTISARTLRRAPTKGLKKKKFALIAQKLDMTLADLRIALNPFSRRHEGALDAAESANLDTQFAALARDGLHDDCVQLARNAMRRAQSGSDHMLIAHWSRRAGSAYRASGQLREASAHLATAAANVQRAIAKQPENLGLLVLGTRIEFGRIMVDEFLIKGAYAHALQRHTALLKEAEAVEPLLPSTLQDELKQAATHVKRQQAEMLRYLGQYAAAQTQIRRVLQEYPTAAFEARSYSVLSEADTLRLSGGTRAALLLYDELEKYARHRAVQGFLAMVLLRKARALELEGRTAERQACVHEAEQIGARHQRRYRYVTIYALLAHAISAGGDTRAVEGRLDEMTRFGNLSKFYCVMEYAHGALCRAEALRTRHQKSEALKWFNVAFECYLRMGCTWGVARSWIGISLSGGRRAKPEMLINHVEGLDAAILKEFEETEGIPVGRLSLNMP